jgi:hypothetical protein
MPTILGQARGQKGTFKTSEGQLIYTVPVIYRIEADSDTQSPSEILQTPGLPIVNFTLMNDGGLTVLCKGKSAEQDKDKSRRWMVTCDFDNEPVKQNENEGQGEGSQGSDPTAWIPVAEIQAEDFEETSFTDVTGAVIANSAGTPFDQLITKYTTIGVLEFEQYEQATQNAYDILDRNNLVNGSTFLTKSAKKWLCKVRKATLGYKNGVKCWKVTYQLKYKSATWSDIRQDVGPVYKTGGTPPYAKFRDEDQNVIPLGNLSTSGTNNGTVTLTKTFEPYGTSSFSFLRIS